MTGQIFRQLYIYIEVLRLLFIHKCLSDLKTQLSSSVAVAFRKYWLWLMASWPPICGLRQREWRWAEQKVRNILHTHTHSAFGVNAFTANGTHIAQFGAFYVCEWKIGKCINLTAGRQIGARMCLGGEKEWVWGRCSGKLVLLKNNGDVRAHLYSKLTGNI